MDNNEYKELLKDKLIRLGLPPIVAVLVGLLAVTLGDAPW